MADMVNKMAEQVKEFNEKITGLSNEATASGLLSDSRMDQRLKHIQEEIIETAEAHAKGMAHEVVDGLVDVIYLAVGTIVEMGVPPDFAFDEVHRANMEKRQGASKRNGQHEAIKPEGWTPPDHKPLLERMEILNQVSDVFVELTKMKIHKGANYNRGSVKRDDHFPLGHYSFFQMMWVKAIRVRSLVESLIPEPGKEITKEEYDICAGDTVRLIRRELTDLINYSDFWVNKIDGKDINK